MLDYTKNPTKTIYTIFFLASLPTRIVYVVLRSVVRPLRKHPKWTFRQALGASMCELWVDFASTIEYRTSKSLLAGSDGERFIVMSPANLDSYLGVLNDKSGKIKPVPIGGMWYPRLYSPMTDAGKKVALHFHGGAYVLGGCRPMESGWGPEVLAKHMDGFVLQPQYRLAVEEDAHFPAALQDGITAFAYLLDLGVKAENIVISGESAGGNLGVELVRWLEEFRGDADGGLPLPRALLMWSPWLNLSIEIGSLDEDPRRKTDYVGSLLADWGVKRYVPKGVDSRQPYISPLGNEFATSVPIFLGTGTAEVLYRDHVKFVENMRKIKGNMVELAEIENAPHDTFGAGLVLGFAKHAEDQARRACLLIESSRYIDRKQ